MQSMLVMELVYEQEWNAPQVLQEVTHETNNASKLQWRR